MTHGLVVVARNYEATAVAKHARPEAQDRVGPFDRARYSTEACKLDVVVADVGPVPASVATTIASHKATYDFVVSAGIAGAFRGRASVGDVVVATESVLADLGTDNVAGRRSGRDEGWPDRVKCLTLKDVHQGRSIVLGQILTMSRQSEDEELVARVALAFPGAVAEAMEGAGVGLAASYLGLPFVEVRAISNIVGVADRTRWNKGAALDALAAVPKLLEHYVVT